MNNGKDLYQLHQLDQEIHERQAALAEAMTQLEDEGPVLQARQRASSGREELARLEREQRDVDAVMSDIQSKLKSGEEKAYGGSVTNPRELEAFEQEAKTLRKRLGKAEERALILMDQVDEAQKTLAASTEELATAEKQREGDVKRLTQESAQTKEALAELERKRKGLSSTIDTGIMNLYESLRSTRGGSAVAKVERGMCQGCRIALPVGVVQQARLGKNVVQCTSCSRILYVS
ncbi:MAG: zinc ribbon domain-containing protein [Dehalococcoidia bacterium]